jgi:hypothetical protein
MTPNLEEVDMSLTIYPHGQKINRATWVVGGVGWLSALFPNP